MQNDNSTAFAKRQHDGRIVEISDTQRSVEHHYDNRGEETRQDRKSAPCIGLKKLNNCLKRTLIAQAVAQIRPLTDQPNREGVLTVVDLCGGKAGDLQKWCHSARLHGQKLCYALIDISEQEVARARHRYDSLSRSDRELFERALFINANAFDVEQLEHSADGALSSHFFSQTDIVSCQFALHYAYESVASASGFWKVVERMSHTAATESPTLLLLSHPCRRRVLEWCAHYANLRDRAVQENLLDNSVCGIAFADPQIEKLVAAQRTDVCHVQLPTHGVCYRFTLLGALDQCPEFLLPPTNVLHSAAQKEASFHCSFSHTVDQLLGNAPAGSSKDARQPLPGNVWLSSTAAREALWQASEISLTTDEYAVACLYTYAMYVCWPRTLSKEEQDEKNCSSSKPLDGAAAVPESDVANGFHNLVPVSSVDFATAAHSVDTDAAGDDQKVQSQPNKSLETGGSPLKKQKRCSSSTKEKKAPTSAAFPATRRSNRLRSKK